MKKLSALVLAVVLSVPPFAFSQSDAPTAAAVSGSASDVAAIRAISKQFVDLWNAKQAQGMMAMLKPEAHFTNYIGTVWKSAEEATVAHAKVFETLFKNSSLAELETEVRFIRPNVAVSHFKWRLTGAIDRVTQKESGPREGYLLFVLEKDAGVWKIHTAQNTDIKVAPPIPESR